MSSFSAAPTCGHSFLNQSWNCPSRSSRASPSPRATMRRPPSASSRSSMMARRGLEGRRPVAIAAAEHQIVDAGCRSRLGLVQPFDELRRIVGRRAVVGGAGDDDRAFRRQVAGVVIEGGKPGVEAVQLGRIRRSCAPIPRWCRGWSRKAPSPSCRGSAGARSRPARDCRSGWRATAPGATALRVRPGRGFTLMRKPSGLIDSVSLILSWYFVWSNSWKRCRIMPSTSVASCMANWRPMQARWPLPHGLKALAGRAASASR